MRFKTRQKRDYLIRVLWLIVAMPTHYKHYQDDTTNIISLKHLQLKENIQVYAVQEIFLIEVFFSRKHTILLIFKFQVSSLEAVMRWTSLRNKRKTKRKWEGCFSWRWNEFYCVDIFTFHRTDCTFFFFGWNDTVKKLQYQIRDFRSCLMIDLGRETDGNNEICLGVHFALCIIKSSTTRSYWALFLGRWSPFFILCNTK